MVARQLRSEAVPQVPHANLGRGSRCESQQGYQRGPHNSCGGPEVRRGRSGIAISRGRSRTRRRMTIPSTRSAASSTTCSCTRPSSGRDHEARCSGGRRKGGHHHRLHGAAGAIFAGLAVPFIPENYKSRRDNAGSLPSSRTACPSLTKGPFRYDFGDTAGLTPLVQDVHAAGITFMPSGIQRGRAAVSRHGADREPLEKPRPHRGGCLCAEPGLRGGASVRDGPKAYSGPGIGPRDSARPLTRRSSAAGEPSPSASSLTPQRPRPF